MTIHVVVGGQFGSEGKGKVTGWLAQRSLAPLVIRVGGPNAGHTVVHPDRGPIALRQVPVGFINPMATLAIAAGSEVDPPVLLSEVDLLGGTLGVVHVDPSATILEDSDKADEAQLVKLIGSTGKGIGAARQRRLARQAQTFGDWHLTAQPTHKIAPSDIASLADTFMEHGSDVIIEGTQGYGLGLHGPYYPYCTSNDTTAIDFLSQARVNPWRVPGTGLEVWVVCRVYPIRVAGNSGPLKDETTWEALGLPTERTTVTQKIRRVGQWDGELVKGAVRANGGGKTNDSVKIYLSMADQMFPTVAGWDGPIKRAHLPLALLDFILDVEEESGAQVAAVGTGPATTMELTS